MKNISQASGKDWRLILLFGGSGLGSLYFLVQALSLFVFWLVSYVSGEYSLVETIPFGVLAWSSLLSCVLLLPVALLSYERISNEPLPGWLDTSDPRLRKWAVRLIFLWPLVVVAGWLVAGKPAAAAFLLGPINVVVAGLPILWIYLTAQKDLEGGSSLRQWTLFGFSLTVMPIVVILLELVAFLVLAIGAGIVLGVSMSQNPQIENELMYIVNQFLIAGGDLDALILLMKPYILQPAVIFWSLAVIGGVMPIIEEVVKPLAIWALARRKITPQEGFVSGLLCGAGFALMENVLYFSMAMTSEDWLFMAIGRAGTGVLHMLASGMVGWGLARAWQDRKWQFLGLTTLGAILLHSFWNMLALVVGVASLFILGPELTLWQTLLFNLPEILLLVVAVFGMILIHRHLRKQAEVLMPKPQDEVELTWAGEE